MSFTVPPSSTDHCTSDDTGSAVRRRKFLQRRVFTDAGLSTAEYAVGTVAVTGLAALLLKLVTSDWMSGLLKGVVEIAFSNVS